MVEPTPHALPGGEWDPGAMPPYPATPQPPLPPMPPVAPDGFQDATPVDANTAPAPGVLRLQARGVRKVYRTGTVEVEALRGVDLDVAAGELVAIMGASGSGKTTLLNCLSGLDDIDGGEVFVDGVDIQRLPDAKRTDHRARSMGFVFQAFNLIPVFTAVENVELPLLLIGTPAKQAREMASDILDRVGLGGRLGNRPNEMSGGEQQRTTVARALVTEPSIVWADEPTGNLDTHTAQTVLDLLWELNEHGQTLIVVTHDPAIGESAGRVVQMRDGSIIADRPQDKRRVEASR